MDLFVKSAPKIRLGAYVSLKRNSRGFLLNEMAAKNNPGIVKK